MTIITGTIRNRREFFYAYDLWSRGASQVEITEKVTVTSRTVERWVNMFRAAPKEETVKDQPFRLLNMNKYEMDWLISECTYADCTRSVLVLFTREDADISPDQSTEGTYSSYPAASRLCR